MVNGVNKNIKHRCSSRSWLGCRREERLTLPAKADGTETVLIAHQFAKLKILNDDAQRQQVQ